MGLLVDTSIFVAAELAEMTLQTVLDHLYEVAPDEERALSVITVAEMAYVHAIAPPGRRLEERRRFLIGLQKVLRFVPVSSAAAHHGGTLNGILKSLGLPLGFADLLIAGTARELGFGVLTSNLKDFARIPELRVVPRKGWR